MEKDNKPIYKLWWFWVIAVLILVFAGLITMRFLKPKTTGNILNMLGIQTQQRGFGNMSEEDREKMKGRFENMSEEEKEELRTQQKPPGRWNGKNQ